MTDRCRDEAPEELRDGIALYNSGAYYECHEILEDIWRAESDPVRFLYQGILQIGVAFHHLGNKNWRGAVGLLTGGIEKVSRFEPVCMGVDTAELVAAAQSCLDRLNELGPDGIERFDWSTVPVIRISQASSDN